MSTESPSLGSSVEGRDGLFAAFDVDAVRVVALGGVALLVTSYLSVFYYLVDVAGSPPTFLTLVTVTLVGATALSSVLRVRTATLLAAGLLAGGLVVYVATLPREPPLVPLATDAIALTTGRRLLLVTNVDVWVYGVLPAPLFLTWYLALRRRYVSSVLAGGAALGFVALTGDAGNVTTLLGALGGVVAVAVGDMDLRGDDLAAAEPLAVLLAVTILLSGLAPVVPGGPGGAASSWSGFQTGGSGPGTVEASLVDAGNELGISGDLSLSPTVRFRVRSEESSYWRVGSYDRFDGSSWFRTGSGSPYRGGRSGPPGETRSVSQTYTVYDDLGVLPAAWKPVSVGDSVADRTRVTGLGGYTIDGTLSANDSYTVESEVPVASGRQLRAAGTDYPSSVVEKYTSLPSSTPQKLTATTSRLTANADNPYETALVVERWLENNKSYSLDVDRPDGNVASKFLFEMDAGYCTYFATTMTTMLRSQGIPARFVVGYTPGERVSEDEWVVRGLDAHAWVEAYFPGTGWVRFDPTPAGPRQQAERAEVEAAREQNRTDVDLEDTGGEEWTPSPTATPAPLTPPDDRSAGEAPGPIGPQVTPPPGIAERGGDGSNGTGTPGATAASGGGGDGGVVSVPDLSREEWTLAAIFLVGLVVGVRRSGVTGRLYRAVWVRYQPREDPVTDAERAFERLEYVLGRRYRPRRPGETPRQYLASIGADERARTVSEIRERARYAGEVTREEADRAVAMVDEVVAG